MPTFSPELLRLLEAIAGPFRSLAGHDSTFALGRQDKAMAGLPDTLDNIARKYSAPGRDLSIAANPGFSDGDPGDMYRILTRGVGGHQMPTTGRVVPPSMDVIRNYEHDDDLTKSFYDIDANGSARGNAKGKGAAMQMYPAAWDLIKANEGTDLTQMLTADNYLRKPAALLSYLLRGHDATHVPLSGEMFHGMDTDAYPHSMDLANELAGTKGRDPRTYHFNAAPEDVMRLQPNPADRIRENSMLLTPDQRVGGLALTEAAKVNQRIGGMSQPVQEAWHDSQWPTDGPAFTSAFREAADPSTLRYLGDTHKIGGPTMSRAQLTDWLIRRHLEGAQPEDTAKLMGSDQAERYGQGLLYAQGGLAQCACEGGRAENYAEGGSVRDDVSSKLRNFFDWLEWERQERKPGFLYGEGYMVDADGRPVNITGHSNLRPMVTGTKEPVLPLRQTNPLMGYHTSTGYFDGSDVPINTSTRMSNDVMPHLDDDFWPGTAKIPRMADGGEVGQRDWLPKPEPNEWSWLFPDQPQKPPEPEQKPGSEWKWLYDLLYPPTAEPAKKMAEGGRSSVIDPAGPFEHVAGTTNARSRSFNARPSEALPANPVLMRAGRELGETDDPVVKRLQAAVLGHGITGQPLDDGAEVQPMVTPYNGGDFAPDLIDALQQLERMKQ